MNERTRKKLTEELECLTNCVGSYEIQAREAQDLADHWQDKATETKETVRQINEDLGLGNRLPPGWRWAKKGERYYSYYPMTLAPLVHDMNPFGLLASEDYPTPNGLGGVIPLDADAERSQ